jgi:PAS domain S-box-containing protein
MAVDQLKASEEQGRKIVEKAADAILTVDKDATICSANEACLEIFGYSEDELLGRPFSLLVPATSQIPPAIDGDADGDELTMARFDPERQPVEQLKALRAWSGHYYETLGIGEDGQALPLEVAMARLDLSKSERFVVVVRDLRVRKKLEEQRRKALRQSKESFRALIENLPDGLIVHRQGTIQYLNPAAGHLLGYQDWGELLGSSIEDLIPRDERRNFFDAAREARDQDEPPQTQEHHFKTRQGERVPVESLTFEAIFQYEKAFISIVRDLTETRQMRMQMMQMERMSAVGTLAAGVAHEINNPLTYVAGNILFVLEELHEMSDQIRPSDDEELMDDYRDWIDALRDTLEGTERIRKIVTDLRTYSQQREPEVKPVDLHQVLETAINMASHEIKHRARLVRDFQPVEPVLADPAGLGQVVLNLLINAAHAISPGSVENQEVRVAIHQDDDQIFIEVSDTGTGIPDDVLPQIFDPFFTTKSSNQGTGLGLAICQNIMQSYGGDLTVETAVGEGTTVVARLPVVPVTETVDAAEEDRQERLLRGTPRILVIDDDEMVRRALTRQLAKNYEVQDVATSHEGLAKIKQNGPFDIILCDLMMPEETGMEFFEQLKKDAPSLREQIIFITGGAVTRDAAEFLETTDATVLKKPFREGELHRRIRDTLKE